MTITDEAFNSFHSRIFDTADSKRLSSSFYWGLAFAVVLHLLLIFYLFHQTFAPPLADPIPSEEPTLVSIERLVKPTPPAPPPPNQVLLHNSVTPPLNQPTVPADPNSEKASGTISSAPPVISDTGGGTGVGATSPSAPTYVTARWTHFPDGDALSAFYPPRAADNEIEGTSTVECTVLDTGGRVSCHAIAETPGNYGFGAATVKMVEAKGRVDTSQGDVKPGSVLRTTVRWQLH